MPSRGLISLYLPLASGHWRILFGSSIHRATVPPAHHTGNTALVDTAVPEARKDLRFTHCSSISAPYCTTVYMPYNVP
jgi:hypothetical protein